MRSYLTKYVQYIRCTLHGISSFRSTRRWTRKDNGEKELEDFLVRGKDKDGLFIFFFQ
jgi:hypothetical protein